MYFFFFFAESIWKLPAVMTIRKTNQMSRIAYAVFLSWPLCHADQRENGLVQKSFSFLCRLRLETILFVCLFNSLLSWLLSFTYLLFMSHRDLEFISLYRDKVYIRQNKQYKFSISLYKVCKISLC